MKTGRETYTILSYTISLLYVVCRFSGKPEWITGAVVATGSGSASSRLLSDSTSTKSSSSCSVVILNIGDQCRRCSWRRKGLVPHEVDRRSESDLHLA